MTNIIRKFLALLCLPFALNPSWVQAADEVGGFYLGVGTGMSYGRDLDKLALRADPVLGITSTGWAIDAKDINYKIFLGYQIDQHLGFEFAYEKMGVYQLTSLPSQTTVKWGSYAFSVSALGIYPITKNVSVYGRLGIANARSRVSAAGLARGENVYSLVYGGGASYMINRNLGLRLEWDRYVNVGTDDLNYVSTGTGKTDVDSLTANAFFLF